MINILAIDTTLGACSTAVFSNGEMLSEMMEVRARGHVERLLPMISETLTNAKLNKNELDFIAVTVGPGTFAGVRIGLSAAKGMALALNIPIIAITSLEAIGYNYVLDNDQFTGKVTVAIDARRGELYTQSFHAVNGRISDVNVAEAVPMHEASFDSDVVIGSGAELLQEVKSSFIHPNAANFGRMAYERLKDAKKPDDVSPLYLRAPDAIIPKKQNMIVTDD